MFEGLANIKCIVVVFNIVSIDNFLMFQKLLVLSIELLFHEFLHLECMFINSCVVAHLLFYKLKIKFKIYVMFI